MVHGDGFTMHECAVDAVWHEWARIGLAIADRKREKIAIEIALALAHVFPEATSLGEWSVLLADAILRKCRELRERDEKTPCF